MRWVCLSAVVLLTPVYSQAPPDTTLRVAVNLVQVDAMVTDRKGQPVPDLRAEDFEILQDGKPQTITHLSYIQTQKGPLPAIPYAGREKPPNHIGVKIRVDILRWFRVL